MAKDLKDIYVGVKKNSIDRHKNDLYPTPPLATYVLQKYIDLPKNIVEPCAGRGNISIELMRNGYNVKSYDLFDYPDKLCGIHTGQDVLELAKPDNFDCLVTNPPYHKDLPRKIAEKAIAEYEVSAFLTRITFFESKSRHELFAKNPPSDILFFSDRIQFSSVKPEPIEKRDQIGGMISYCWVVFDKRKKSTFTNLKWILLENEYEEWRRNYNRYHEE